MRKKYLGDRNMETILRKLRDKAIKDKNISGDEASLLYELGEKEPFLLMAHASAIRQHFKEDRVELCSIINAKSGICPENCRFCAQSAHYHTDAPVYPLLGATEIVREAQRAKASGAHCFGIVTSGTSIESDREWETLFAVIREIGETGIKPCASVGILEAGRARQLKAAGLFRYHHNLETARSFFDHICTTHAYDDDIQTNLVAKEAGLSTCSGGIIGLGETMEQRIELAITIREMEVDSVPINILNPIPGTPLACNPPLTPMEILLTIALFRFLLPDKGIRLCGGKEKNLRQALPLGLVAGASALMTGDYLTTSGRQSKDDIEMVLDLGMNPDAH
jgi:biotin synthase